MKTLLLFLVVILFISFIASYVVETQGKNLLPKELFSASSVKTLSTGTMNAVRLTAQDDVLIAADYYPGSGTKGALLVHMMPRTKASWQGFARLLQGAGYHVLAIDLRGHGESAGGPNGYVLFSDKDHQKSIADLEAGADFLKEKGVRPESLSLIGASIGANLSLWYLADHPEVRQAVLLSAGLNYRGIDAAPLFSRLGPGRRLLLVASEDDFQNGASEAEANRVLAGLVPAGAEVQTLFYKRAGHGTDMFGKEPPDLTDSIIRWVQ